MAMQSGKLLMMAGWETGSLASYTNVGNNSGSAIVTTAARTGTRALQCNRQEYVNIPLGATVGEVGICFGFYMLAQDITETPSIVSPSALLVPWLRIRAVGGNRKLSLVNGSNYNTTTEVWIGSQTLSLNTWYVIALYLYRQSEATATGYWPCRVKLFDNNLVLLEDSGWQATYNTYSSGGTFNSVYLGQGPADAAATSGVHQFLYDDVVITRGAPPPIGARIVGVAPTGDGTDDGYKDGGGGATTWDDVDEVPPDDAATYATSSGGTSGAQTYTHAPVSDPGTSGNILGVCGHARMIRRGAINTTGQVRLKTSAGAFSPSPGVTVSTTWVAARGISQVSFAGNGWTPGSGSETSIDDLEFGVLNGLYSLGRHLDLTQAYLEVAWGNDWTNTGDLRFFPDKKNYILGGY